MAGKMHLENLTIAGKMQLVGWKMQLKNLIMARKMQMGKVMHTVAWKLYLKKKISWLGKKPCWPFWAC